MSHKKPRTYQEWYDFATECMDVLVAQGHTFNYDPRKNAALSALANQNQNAKLDAFVDAIDRARYEPEVMVVPE